jgi:hypothetical protein
MVIRVGEYYRKGKVGWFDPDPIRGSSHEAIPGGIGKTG